MPNASTLRTLLWTCGRCRRQYRVQVFSSLAYWVEVQGPAPTEEPDVAGPGPAGPVDGSQSAPEADQGDRPLPSPATPTEEPEPGSPEYDAQTDAFLHAIDVEEPER